MSPAAPRFDPTQPCTLCPRACGAIRAQSPGYCGGGERMRVALAQLHHGEEPPISGPGLQAGLPPDRQTGPERGGSGTIFFSGCALKCAYCQNHSISFGPESSDSISLEGCAQPPGHELDPDDLAALMLELELAGAHNVNLVTAGHYAPLVRQALLTARGAGLRVPVVWNSSGYESVDTLRTLEGLVDIYLPDLRYMDARAAARYSAAPDYPKAATFAICEMRRQVGARLLIDEATGLATRGLIIRLLVLPGNAGRTDLALDWIADTLGPDTPVSLMGQYYPTHRAARFPEIDRGVTPEEYALVRRRMEELGFTHGFVQEVGSTAAWTPDFSSQEG